MKGLHLGTGKSWLILLCGLLAYKDAPAGVFQYDDHKFLAMPYVQGGPLALPDLFYDSFNYGLGVTLRPMALTTFNLNYWLFGTDTTHWVMFGMLIHLACAYVIFEVVKHLTKKPIVALSTALLFVCSPITPYAVTYITQSRMEALAALCIMSTLLLYIRGYKLLSIIPCVVGCLCKETAYITPFLIFLYAVFFEDVSRRKLAVIALGGISLVVVGACVNEPLKQALVGNGWWLSSGLLGRMEPLMTLDILGEYTKRILMPAPVLLSIDPGYYPYQNSILWCIPTVAVVGVFIYKAREYRKVIAFALLAYLLFLAVPLAILPIKPDDKLVCYKAYLACFPAYLFVSLFLERFLREKMFFILAPVIIVFCFATDTVNNTFASEAALWKDAALKAPDRLRPHYNTATAMLIHGDNWGQAKTWYEKTLQIAEGHKIQGKKFTDIEKECIVKSWYNLGLIHVNHGDMWNGIECLVIVRHLPRAQEQLKKIERYLAEHED